jgi:hypothetical protein
MYGFFFWVWKWSWNELVLLVIFSGNGSAIMVSLYFLEQIAGTMHLHVDQIKGEVIHEGHLFV